MKSLFETETYSEIENRIHSLNENTERQWGKMDVAQMMNHCQKPLRIPLGKSSIKKPNFLIKMFAMSIKPSMYSDKPWKKNLRTAPGFAVTEPKEFQEEKDKLLRYTAEFHDMKNLKTMPVHPVFGTFTKEQWGQMQYKHLDHHLRQFGV